MPELVTMVHPDIDAPAVRQSAKAVEHLQSKGWQLAPDAVADAAEVVGEPVTDLSRMNKSELISLAESRGVDVSDNPTKDELVARLSSE